MNAWLGPLLAVTVVAASAVALVTFGLFRGTTARHLDTWQ